MENYIKKLYKDKLEKVMIKILISEELILIL